MKLIASDYDHTLRFDETVDSKTIQAIKEFRSKGNLFAVVTGRSFSTIYHELVTQNLEFDFLVCSNGAMITDSKGNIMYENYIDINVASKMIDFAEDNNFPFFVCSDGHKVYGKYDLGDERSESHRIRHLNNRISKEELLAKGKMISMVVRGYDQAHLTELKDLIEANFKDKVSCYQNQWVFDIMAKGTSKAQGIIEALKHYDVSEVYAIGDDYNDIPMVEYFNGYCVDNAVEPLKRIAKKSYESVRQLMEELI